MPSKKQRAKAMKAAEFSRQRVAPESIAPDSTTGQDILRVIKGHLCVQKFLNRPFGKINMLVIKEEGDDWLYGEESKEGLEMFTTKLKNLELEFPNVCENWHQMFHTKMVMSTKYKPGRGIDDDARFFFCCCLKEGGAIVRDWKMDHGTYFTFYDSQSNPIV